MVATQPKLAKATRRRAIRLLANVAQRLSAPQQRLANVLQELAPPRRLNIPLISRLVNMLDYKDNALPLDLTRGVLIAGEIPHTGVLPSRVTTDVIQAGAPPKGLFAGNKTIAKSIARTCDAKLREKCAELSRKEHQQGWPSAPTPITEGDLDPLILSPRFCISERHGAQQPKYRVIDDLSMSLANSTATMTDTYCPQDLDSLVAQTRLLDRVGARNLKAWSVYVSNAYETILLHRESHDASLVCFVDPRTNTPHKARILVQPFGSRRAPSNWWRVVTFSQFVAHRLFNLSVGALGCFFRRCLLR